MNWYKQAKLQRFASVTFIPSGTHRVARPMMTEDIASDIRTWANKALGLQIYYDVVTSDGNDFDKPIGTINFYETGPITPEVIQKIVTAYNTARDGVVRLQIAKREQSKRFKSMVTRVRVIQNETTKYEVVPELNIANNSAFQLLKYLKDQGLDVNPEELSGSFSADALRFIMSDKTPPSPRTYENEVHPGMESLQEELGEAKVVNYSRPIDERFHRYLQTFQQMIDYIDRHQLPDRNITFG